MSELIGSWHLTSCEHRAGNKRVSLPLGEHPSGLLIYSREGRMSVLLSAQKRALFQSVGLFEGTDPEKSHAASTFVSYGGRYRIDGNKIIHHVEISLFPNWVGTQQIRFFEMSGETLILSTPPFIHAGEEQIAYLSWLRVHSTKK